MSISMIYDDGNPKYYSFSGNQWSHLSSTNSLYNNTVSVCDTTFSNSSTTTPVLTLNFYGTDVNMYGPAVSGGNFNYTIDSTSVRPAEIISNAVGKHGGKIWGLQGLDNATYHTLQILPSAGVFNFDYMTVTPVKYTTIAGIDAILDDADDTIVYSSGWTATSTGSYGTSLPYEGTVTSTNTAGSKMTFNFIGASISVYGLLNQNSGKLSVSFSVDSGTTTSYKPFDGTQTVSASQWSANQLFYHQDLVPGNHTLSVKVDEVSGSQALYIDSLVFEATSNTPITKADAAAKAKAANPPTPSSSGGLSGGALAGIIMAGIALFLLFMYVRRQIQAAMARFAAQAARNNANQPSSSSVLRRPQHARSNNTMSATEDGAAFPLVAPTQPFSPPQTPPFTNSEMSNLSSRYSDYINSSTIPVSMPVPYMPVPVNAPPSSQQYYPTPPLVDISPTVPPNQNTPSNAPQQDGSDFPQPSSHNLSSTSQSNHATPGLAQTQHQTAQPSSTKPQPVVLTYTPNEPHTATAATAAAAQSSSIGAGAGARVRGSVRSATMNSDAPPPYNIGEALYDHHS